MWFIFNVNFSHPISPLPTIYGICVLTDDPPNSALKDNPRRLRLREEQVPVKLDYNLGREFNVVETHVAVCWPERHTCPSLSSPLYVYMAGGTLHMYNFLRETLSDQKLRVSECTCAWQGVVEWKILLLLLMLAIKLLVWHGSLFTVRTFSWTAEASTVKRERERAKEETPFSTLNKSFSEHVLLE